MTTKQIRIMFYDESQKSWVVDTMDVASEEDNPEESEQAGDKDSDAPMSYTMAYL